MLSRSATRPTMRPRRERRASRRSAYSAAVHGGVAAGSRLRRCGPGPAALFARFGDPCWRGRQSAARRREALMARKLKTYQTSLGFFDQAIAAPSMKAALEAWGADSNLFHQGAAKESHDPDVIAATMAKPGVVLKRPVGSDGPFSEHAELPTNLGRMKGRSRPQAERPRRRSLPPSRTRLRTGRPLSRTNGSGASRARGGEGRGRQAEGA